MFGYSLELCCYQAEKHTALVYLKLWICNASPSQVRSLQQDGFRYVQDLQELSSSVWITLLPGLCIQERYKLTHTRVVTELKS